MHLVPLIGCSVGSLVWGNEHGGSRTTLIVKRTYGLSPGLPLLSLQEPIIDDAALASGLDRPNDRVPYKPRVDCIVLGSAALGSGAGRGDFEVILHRASGQAKWLRMDAPGSLRRTSLGQGGLGRILRSVPPSGSDAESFQAAPADQQVSELALGDALELRSSERTSLRLMLPTALPQAVLFESSLRLLELRTDTLLIDTDRQLLALTSRVELGAIDPETLVVVTEGRSSERLPELRAELEQDGRTAARVREWGERQEAAKAARSSWSGHAPLALPEQQSTLVLEAPSEAEIERAAASVGFAAPFVQALPVQAPRFEPPAAPARLEPPPPVTVLRVEAAVAPMSPATMTPALQGGPEAQLPSYLRGSRSGAVQQPASAHEERAAFAGVVAASDAAADSAVRAVAPAVEAAAPGVIELLFLDERALREAQPAAALAGMLATPPPKPRTAREISRSWAQRPAALELESQAREALTTGRETPLDKVGFRASGRALVEADLARVCGEFEPALSRFAVLKAMVQVAGLSIIEEPHAQELASLGRSLDPALSEAPEQAFAPLLARLERVCDGQDGRPSLHEVQALAETTVLATRGFAKTVLRSGRWVRGTLRSGDAALPLYVPEEFERTLPNVARFQAVALVLPSVSRDPRESGSLVLAAIALGRSLDPKTLTFQRND